MGNDQSTEGLPQFRGFIIKGSDKRGFTFVDIKTVRQIRATEMPFRLPTSDLRVHVKQNGALGDPIPSRVWITFFARRGTQNKNGVDVLGAEIDKAQPPKPAR